MGQTIWRPWDGTEGLLRRLQCPLGETEMKSDLLPLQHHPGESHLTLQLACSCELRTPLPRGPLPWDKGSIQRGTPLPLELG